MIMHKSCADRLQIDNIYINIAKNKLLFLQEKEIMMRTYHDLDMISVHHDHDAKVV